MHKKTGWAFALIALILGGCIYFLSTGTFLLGIDLRGGTELVYDLDMSLLADAGPGVAEEQKKIVANRLDIFGLKEISISIQGGNRMVVQVPGASDSQDVEVIRRLIEQAGTIDFMLAAFPEHQTPARLKEIQEEENRYLREYRSWIARKKEHDARYRAQGQEPPDFKSVEAEPPPPEFIARIHVENVEEVGDAKPRQREVPNLWAPGERFIALFNGPQYKVSGEHLSKVGPSYDDYGRPAVSFSFKPEGASQFAALTQANKEKYLAILLDDQIRQIAKIKSRIHDQGQLTGSFSRKEVDGIVTILRGGNLRAKPRLASQSTVGAVLGNDSIEQGKIAVVAGLTAICAFLLVYYLWGGVVANAALVFNVIIILAFVLVFRQTLTFPGIAGIVLTLAMAIDANILIFERVREELARGKSLLHALGTGYQRAFWVIFDSNITTILTGAVLFQIGTGPVKG
ncbi:MAG: protein translocase subunit SecD, partial [Anaerolineales bacterium]